jgi:hypothetical protein
MARKINKVVLHCSDSPDGRDIGLKDINEWHKERGFTPTASGIYCGYHWVIRIDGVIEMGRPESEKGIHCTGQNSNSIAICLAGRSKFTEDQWTSLYYLLGQICTGYDLEAKHVFGHYEFNAHKTCPNIDMTKLRDALEMFLNKKEK